MSRADDAWVFVVTGPAAIEVLKEMSRIGGIGDPPCLETRSRKRFRVTWSLFWMAKCMSNDRSKVWSVSKVERRVMVIIIVKLTAEYPLL